MNHPNDLTVIAGTVNSNEPLSSRGVEKIVVHEHFNEQSPAEHDIAMIKVRSPFTMTEPHMKPVVLPKQGATLSVGAEGMVAGWARVWVSILSVFLE